MNSLIISAIIIAVTFVIINISDFIFKRMARNTKKIHLAFTKGVCKILILVIGIIALGMQFDVTKELSRALFNNTALLVAVLGFAAQQTLNDILSGFMISWSRPFDIGERIHLVSQNISGLVEDITLRHTVIRCFDNNRIIIPNSVINKEILKNSNYEDSVIGNYLEVGVSSNSDVREAMRLMSEVIESNSLVITTEDYSPGLLVIGFNRDGFVLKATIWTKTMSENFGVCSELRIQIKEVFDEHGIELLPQIITNLIVNQT